MIDFTAFDWNTQTVLSKNRCAPRVHFYPYAHKSAALSGNRAFSDRVESLNGLWNFNWFSSPLEVPDLLLHTPYDPEAPSISVPMNWQYAGFGKFCYTDLLYPFPADPPHVPMENETGVYRRAFHVDSEDSMKTFLRFEGVESAFHLFVNGTQAGYSQGSRMPSEFDVTALVHPGENQLAVVVYQYCDGTYLEDQDMWWLGGITREVLLLRRPQNHLLDFILNPDYDVQTGEGILWPMVPVSGPASVRLEVYDASGALLQTKGQAELRISGVQPWTAETPALYTVVAQVLDEQGRCTEAACQRIGFRHISIEDGVLKVNGSPIFMRGVNRHEYNPKTGRAITREQTARELATIKDAGLNAIRCSHYPNNPFFYDLCDELGLYVIDECDLETHGFEPLGTETRLCSDPHWKEAYLDRIRRMVGRDRNRACVIMWSLGNESAYGSNFRAMYRWCKEHEPSRPVHYEGDFHNQSVDVSSTMYSTIGRLKELDLQQDPKRPHILCEFAHAMGNGPGGLEEYFKVCEESQRIQGLFVWEFKDHGVYEEGSDGKVRYRFGGEFGEAFHNGNFCMDGLVRSDGVPSPGFWEYARVAEPIHVEQFDLKTRRFTLKNRFDFLDLSLFSCKLTVLYDGTVQSSHSFGLPPIGPRQKADLSIDASMLEDLPREGLVTLEVEFLSTAPVGKQPIGWIAGRATAVVREESTAPAEPKQPAACTLVGHTLHISGSDFSCILDPVTGCIRDYRVHGRLLLEQSPFLNYNRPYTDNDQCHAEEWNRKHLHSMKMCVKSLDWATETDALVITVRGDFAPAALDWGTHVKMTYHIWDNGAVSVSFQGEFYGTPPTELPKIGTQSFLPAEIRSVVYRGYGPGECYCDSKQAQADGIWSGDPHNMGFDYSCPQENGNRTGVRWLVLSGPDGSGLSVAASRPIDMALRPYSDEMLRSTAHACDLVHDSHRLYLHLDYRNSGLGSGSCGPAALQAYKAYPIAYEWSLAFAPVDNALTPAQNGRRALGYLK